jgi:kumamolisin
MSNDQTMLPIPGSHRNAVANAKFLGHSDPNQTIRLSIYARRNPHPPANLHVDLDKLSSELPRDRHYLNDTDFTALYGASKEDLATIAAWARENHLKVLKQDAATKRTEVEGTVGDISKAFKVQLDDFEHPELGKYRGRSGKIYVPSKLFGVVEGVFGLDNRPVGKPRLRRSRSVAMTLQPGVNPYAGCFFPTQVAKLYNYPAFDGTGQNVAIFAFNGPQKAQQGGYSLSALKSYFTTVLGQQTPVITDVVVQGPGNDPGPDTAASNKQGDATGEVMLDMCTVGAIVPGAHLFLYFSEFTSQGWVNILHESIAGTNNISVISNSYGNPEQDPNSAWSKMAVSVVNQALEAAVARGITIFSAAGDDGSSDEGKGQPEVDFPASSPYVTGVGGTRLVASSGTNPVITSETVWNDLMQGNGAGGGGISVVFSKPSWQDGVNVPPSVVAPHPIGRGVPDVSAVADPETALVIVHVNGQRLDAVGGTSAAAPLWAALTARINQGLKTSCGFINQLLYTKFPTGVLRDITQGNNGAYSAGPGWDACTGLGSPNGGNLLTALGGKPVTANNRGGRPTGKKATKKAAAKKTAKKKKK